MVILLDVLLLAHTGHWLLWVLYAVPVLIVVGSIVFSILRQRREAAEGGDPGSVEAD